MGSRRLAFLVQLVVLLVWGATADLCDSYDSRCEIELGKPASHGSGFEDTVFDINEDQSMYFSIAINPDAVEGDLQFSLMSLYGDVDMVINVDAEPTDDSGLWYSGVANSLDLIYVSHADLEGGEHEYVIWVVPFQASKFRLLVSTTETTKTLHDGVPQRDSALKNQYTYFTFEVPADSEDIITVAVTPLSGDPDLIVSISGDNTKPTLESYDYRSDEAGADTVVMSRTASDDPALFGPSLPTGAFTVYIGVMAFESSSFSLTASSGKTPTLLVDGLPYMALVDIGGEMDFVFETGEGHNDVEFTLTPRHGHLALTVTTEDGGSWESNEDGSVTQVVTVVGESTGGDVVIVESAPSRYNVRVWGGSNSGGTGSASFILTATSSLSVKTLLMGEMVSATVPEHAYEYYEVHMSDLDQAILVDVTVMSGDPDVFVSCEFDPTGNDDGSPSRMNFNVSSNSYAEERIVLSPSAAESCAANAVLGQSYSVFIAVFGFESSLYTIAVSVAGLSVTLLNGAPQSGVVGEGEYNYYRFYMGDTATTTQFRVSAQYGDPDLFIRIPSESDPDPDVPTVDDYTMASQVFGVEVVEAPARDMCTNCWITVGVYGYSDSAYTVVAQTALFAAQLQSGVPSAGEVAEDDFIFYRYEVPADVGAGATLEFTLTPLTGDADILVSHVNAEPVELADGNFESMNQGQESENVVISGAETGSWYISVYGYTASSYTLMVTLATASSPPIVQALVESVPQSGSVQAGTFTYYSLTVEAGFDALDVSTIVLYGSVAVYINQCPGRLDSCTGRDGGVSYLPTEETKDQAQWSSETSVSLGGAHVRLEGSSGDGDSSGPITYVIGLYGATTSSASPYFVTASLAASTVSLVENVPYTSDVTGGHYAYFRFPVLEANKAITISVTAITGDPDLYVDTVLEEPTLETATWSHEFTGADTLTILSDDPNACVDCVYYIGVLGFGDSSFTISVGLEDDRPTLLTNGMPQSGHVMIAQIQHYQLIIDEPAVELQIVLIASYGDPDLYVSLEPMDVDPHSLWPSSERDPEFGSDSSVADSVSIRPDASAWTAAGCDQSCIVRVTVEGFTASDFTLTAALATEEAGASVMLQSAQPYQGSLASSTSQYFRLWVDSDMVDIVMSLTLQSGSAAMYASCVSMYPDEQGALDWLSAEQGDGTQPVWTPPSGTSQLLSLSHSDLEEAGCIAPFFMYVGVHTSTTGSAVYGLTGTLNQGHENGGEDGDDGSQLELLVSGHTASGEVGLNEIRLYKLRLGPYSAAADVDVDVTLTLTGGGDAELYVSQSLDLKPWYDGGVGGVVCGSEVCDRWGHGSSGAGTTLHLSHEQFVECADGSSGDEECYYVFGIRGLVEGTEYRLVASTGSGMTALQNGVPHQGVVGDEEYVFFTVALATPDADLTVVVTALGGDPDVYVSPEGVYDRPTDEGFVWGSWAWGSETLTIQSAELTLMSDCVPNPSQGLVCNYNIGVIGYGETSFLLLAYEDVGWTTPLMLLPGLPQTGQLDASEFEYYQFPIVEADASYSITISLTPVDGGDPDLFLTTDGSVEVGPDNFEIEASELGGELVVLRPDSPLRCAGCTLHLAVQGFSATSYTLVVSRGMVRLQSGVSHQAVISEPRSFQYFSFVVDDPETDLEILVTPLSGDPDMYVTSMNPLSGGDWDDMSSTEHSSSAEEEEGEEVAVGDWLPTLTHFSWVSRDFGADSIMISHTDAHNTCSGAAGGESVDSTGCEYVIGVYAFTNTSFTILATAAEEQVVSLVHGRPQVGATDAGQYKYYSIAVSSSTEELTIRLAPSSGAAELYVASRVLSDEADGSEEADQLPEGGVPGSYTWTSHEAEENMVTIPPPEGGFAIGSRFVIGVYCLANAGGCHYSVMAASATVPLVLQGGVPQRHFLGGGETAFFSFNLDVADSDLSFAVTAFNGDPDLFISTTNERPVEGEATWESTYYGSDELVISHSSPCSLISHATDGCEGSMYKLGQFYVGVTAFAPTNFTLMASARGTHVTLLPGQPQTYTTRLDYLCDDRDEDDQCTDESAYQAQSAFFSFKITCAELGPAQHVSVSLQPNCTTSASSDVEGQTSHCPIGCPCNPLSMQINYCMQGECESSQRYPSANPANAAMHRLTDSPVSGGRVSAFIEHDPESPQFCAAEGGDGIVWFYVGVFGASELRNSVTEEELLEHAHFTLSYSTPSGVNVLPRPEGAEGVLLVGPEVVAGGGTHDYEAYVERGGELSVQLQLCSGTPMLYMCDSGCEGVHPRPGDFAWSRTETRSCTRGSDGEPSCEGHKPTPATISVMEAAEENYFLSVIGSGSYMLQIATGGRQHILQPTELGADSVDGAGGGALDGLLAGTTLAVSSLTTTGFTLAWLDAELELAGSGGNRLRAIGVEYTVYALPLQELKAQYADIRDFIAYTSCGMDTAAERTGSVGLRAGTHDAATVGASLEVMDLEPDTQYVVNVVAVCDVECMTATLADQPGGGVGLAPISLAYSSIPITTMAYGFIDASAIAKAAKVSPTTVAVVVGGMGALMASLYLMYRRNAALKNQLVVEMSDVSDLSGMKASLPAVAGGASGGSMTVGSSSPKSNGKPSFNSKLGGGGGGGGGGFQPLGSYDDEDDVPVRSSVGDDEGYYF